MIVSVEHVFSDISAHESIETQLIETQLNALSLCKCVLWHLSDFRHNTLLHHSHFLWSFF